MALPKKTGNTPLDSRVASNVSNDRRLRSGWPRESGMMRDTARAKRAMHDKIIHRDRNTRARRVRDVLFFPLAHDSMIRITLSKKKNNGTSERAHRATIGICHTMARSLRATLCARRGRAGISYMWVNGITVDTANFYKLLENSDCARST